MTQPGRAACLYIALTPVLAIFALIPLELFSTSAEYWRWNSSFPFRFIFVGTLIYLALAGILAIVGRFNALVMARAALFLFYLGVLVLLADVLAPLQTGLLDGSALESSEPMFYTLLEMGLLGLVLLLARKLGANASRVAILMTSLFLATSVGYALYAGTLRPEDSSTIPPRVTEQQQQGNVYHIVLDEMQTDAALAFLTNRNLESSFQGFSLYKNNISNYLFTSVSMPSYLTGDLYRSGDFVKWQDSYKEGGLFRDVYEAGYDLELYSVYDHWCSPYARQCQSLDDIFEQETGLLGSEFVTFVQIWFARIMPNAVTNWALAQGKMLGNKVDERLNATVENVPKTVATGRAPYSSILLLKALITGEEQKSADGRYVYVHTIIPHGPYVMDADCIYDAQLWKREGSRKAYYEQAGCALNKVADFLGELQRLGRYRDSTIIVHADTGHGHLGFLDFDDGGRLLDRESFESPVVELDEKFRKTEEWYLARSMALFMLKPAQSSGDMAVSSRSAHLTDLYPTLVNLLGLQVEIGQDAHGLDLSSPESAPLRPADIFFTTPARPGDIVSLSISDQSDIRHSSLSRETLKPVTRLPTYELILGLDDGLELEGFSYPEKLPDGSRHWRWVTGTEASIDLSPRLAVSAGKHVLELEIEPFVGNRNTVAEISIGGHAREVKLSDSWESYQLVFNFAGDEAPLVQFRFDTAVSPEALGISADQRPLAARISRIAIRPADE